MSINVSNAYVTPMRSLIDWLDIKGLGAIVLSLLATRRELVVACVIMLTIDWATGMMAAYKRGEAIQSSKMRRIVPKAIEYFLFAVACTVVGNAFPHIAQWVPEWGVGIIVGTEFKSIIENVYPDNAGHWAAIRARLPWAKYIDKDKAPGDNGDAQP